MRVKQKGIRNTPNKPWWVEIVTSRNRLYRPYAISEHSLFIYHKDWEFTHEFFQEKPNIDEYVQIQTSVQQRNCMKSESLSKVHSWESLIFQICNLFHRFSKYNYITIICSPICCWFISLVILVNKGDFSHLGTYTFLTSPVHVPLKTVFNQIW